jgi:hypothetical protein
MRIRRTALFALMIPGCLSTSEPNTSEPSRSESGGLTPERRQCALRGDTCGPPEECCGRVLGKRVHLEEGCTEGFEVVACVPAKTPGDACISADSAGCIARDVDGGQDVFWTSSLWRDDQIAGFTHCSEELRARALAAGNYACP